MALDERAAAVARLRDLGFGTRISAVGGNAIMTTPGRHFAF
jgi:hypothetical protein